MFAGTTLLRFSFYYCGSTKLLPISYHFIQKSQDEKPSAHRMMRRALGFIVLSGAQAA
jgi:hypothetical protein